MSEPVHVTVGLTVRADRLDAWHALVAHHARESRREAGCLRFEVLGQLGAPCRWLLVETWRDQAALEAHRLTPHYARWREEAPLCQAVARTHDEYRAWEPGRPRVVFANGCFDLLHAGHVHTLEWARQQGDRLVVGLNSDASCRRLKGPGRPVVRERDRAAVLRALACVDEVVVFDEGTPERLIGELRPAAIVKGPDYADRENEVAGAGLAEILIAPAAPFACHTSDLLRLLRGSAATAAPASSP